MCGIVGYLQPAGIRHEPAVLNRAIESLVHRGPDDSGMWCDDRAGIALGHRRLAIQDPSPAGKQPMISRDGRWYLTYNGEIYNHYSIRRELQALHPDLTFAGHSDTNTLVEAIACWGVNKAVAKAVGMFAFAAWDRKHDKLYLCRDRLGIKPLYWAMIGEGFYFASEVKAILSFLQQTPDIDPDALALYFRYSYVPAPFCIFQGLGKVEAGCIVRLARGRQPETQRYWSLQKVIADARSEKREQDSGAWISETEQLLSLAVQDRLLSDVPLGALLSGGIDSATVVALMQEYVPGPVDTFTVAFSEAQYDESRQAARIANHLGTAHHELQLGADDALDAVAALADIYDEPFADSSQLPTYLISRFARSGVTVALSGDGGDELFAGYNRHILAAGNLRRLYTLPRSVRLAFGGVLAKVPPRLWDRLQRLLPDTKSPPQLGDKLAKLAAVLAEEKSGVYQSLLSCWRNPALLLAPGVRARTQIATGDVPLQLAHWVEQMQYQDTLGYLPDDILTKVDRASMAVSLEVRVPYLDHRVVEQAWRLPMALKTNGRSGKIILRRILARYLPEELIKQQKSGFSIPLRDWLRGGLRSWAESLLSEHELARHGYLRSDIVRGVWHQHLKGRVHQHQLWTVLMFQAWHRKWYG